MIRTAAGAVLAMGVVSASQAQEPPQLVAQAAAVVQERGEPGQRWSFVRTLTRGEAVLSAAYDPSRPAGEQWTLLTPSSIDELTDEVRTAFESFAQEETPDLDVVLGDEENEEGGLDDLIGENVSLVSDDGSEAVFTFTPPETEGLDASAPMAGELALNSAEPMITSLRFFALEPFKPNPAARIASLNIVLHFAETTPGGPIAIVSSDTQVSGSALFREFSEAVSVTNTEFARVAVGSDPQPAE